VAHVRADALPAPADDSLAGNHGVRYSRWSFLFTMASMVIVVNSVLGGATAELVASLGVKALIVASTAVGIVVGLILLVLGLGYEHHRLTPVVIGALDDAELTGGRQPAAT
jgi:hypothetical protein